MKATLIALATLVTAPSFGAELACWNLYAKKGDRPTFTATIENDGLLSNPQILDNSSVFGEYDISDVLPEAEGSLITTNRSPYKGGQEFFLTADGQLRLILPADLSPEGLKAAWFNAGGLPENLMQRQNGVLDVAGSRTHSGGSVFNRMHCVSKN